MKINQKFKLFKQILFETEEWNTTVKLFNSNELLVAIFASFILVAQNLFLRPVYKYVNNVGHALFSLSLEMLEVPEKRQFFLILEIYCTNWHIYQNDCVEKRIPYWDLYEHENHWLWSSPFEFWLPKKRCNMWKKTIDLK